VEKRFPNHPHLRRLLLCSRVLFLPRECRDSSLDTRLCCSLHRRSQVLSIPFVAGTAPEGGRRERESLGTKLSLGFPSMTPCPNYGGNALVYVRMIISTQSDPWKDHKFGLPHISVFNLFFSRLFLARSLDGFLFKFCLIPQVFVIQIFCDIF